MEAGRDVWFKGAWPLALFSILLLFMSTAARGEELYTRKDELQCGMCWYRPLRRAPGSRSRASSRLYRAAFHLLEPADRDFSQDKSIGRAGRGADRHNENSQRAGRDGACIRGKEGLYVVIGYWTGVNCGTVCNGMRSSTSRARGWQRIKGQKQKPTRVDSKRNGTRWACPTLGRGIPSALLKF